MTLTACVLCHYQDLRPRWLGGVLATWCESCGCLYFSASALPEGVSTLLLPGDRHAPRSSGTAVPAPFARLQIAATVTKASPAH